MGSCNPANRHVMQWQSTLGAMKTEGTRVIRTCAACGFWGEVDLDHMEGLLGGPEMTLWDCWPPCPLCDKLMHHMASPGSGTPYRPLTSLMPDDFLALPPQAWMARWFGRR